MKFANAARVLDGIPYTSRAKGAIFYDLVLRERPKQILELGFAHGVSSCYLAAAAQEIGGHVTAVDLADSVRFDPSIETLVERLGLGSDVSVHRVESSYTWFLKKEIEAQTSDGVCRPKYDLVFIDGPKDWTNDGCAFFLADKLLRPGGIVLFDDYEWSYRGDTKARGKVHNEGYVFKRMSEEEFEVPHVKAIFELLVMQHPQYGAFEVIDNQLGLARKTGAVDTKRVLFETRMSLRYRAVGIVRGMFAQARALARR